jgi:hypothetical protein
VGDHSAGLVKVRRKGAVLRVDVYETEAALLGVLFDDLGQLFAETNAAEAGPMDPVVERLFPDGYTDDEAASAEYRDLVAASLREERIGRLQACRAEVPDGAGRFELDDEAADRWLRVLNDLRLALGTRLGVTEESELDDTDEGVNVYQWLTAVQDMLVTHLMG